MLKNSIDTFDDLRHFFGKQEMRVEFIALFLYILKDKKISKLLTLNRIQFINPYGFFRYLFILHIMLQYFVFVRIRALNFQYPIPSFYHLSQISRANSK